MLLVMVLSAEQVSSVLFGQDEDGVDAASVLPRDAVVMQCATVTPAFARETASRLAKRGLLMLDAPVSGGTVGAEAGSLTVMASGPDAAFDKAQSVAGHHRRQCLSIRRRMWPRLDDEDDQPALGGRAARRRRRGDGLCPKSRAGCNSRSSTSSPSARATRGCSRIASPTCWQMTTRPQRRRHLAQGFEHRARNGSRRKVSAAAGRRGDSAVYRCLRPGLGSAG